MHINWCRERGARRARCVYAASVNTHVHVAQEVVEATVAVVGGAAEGFEDAQPLSTQRATVGSQLRT